MRNYVIPRSASSHDGEKTEKDSAVDIARSGIMMSVPKRSATLLIKQGGTSPCRFSVVEDCGDGSTNWGVECLARDGIQ